MFLDAVSAAALKLWSSQNIINRRTAVMTSLILHVLDCVHMLFYPVIKDEIVFPLKSVGEILWIHCIVTLAVIWTTKQLQNLLTKLTFHYKEVTVSYIFESPCFFLFFFFVLMKSQADTSFQVILWERVSMQLWKINYLKWYHRKIPCHKRRFVMICVTDCCLSLVLVLSLDNGTMCSYPKTCAVSVKDCDV